MFIIDQINARALEQAVIRIIYDNSCIHQIVKRSTLQIAYGTADVDFVGWFLNQSTPVALEPTGVGRTLLRAGQCESDEEEYKTSCGFRMGQDVLNSVRRKCCARESREQSYMR